MVRNMHVRGRGAGVRSSGAGSRAEAVVRLGDVFRTHGYEGASLAAITAATGLGKGSLYNFFPGGKAEMAAAVLAEEAAWFRHHVLMPLRQAPDPRPGIAHMLDMLDRRHDGGRRACVMAVFALDAARETFATEVDGFYADWTAALADALAFLGRHPATARTLAEEAVAQVEGALVLARARGEPRVFAATLERLRKRLA